MSVCLSVCSRFFSAISKPIGKPFGTKIWISIWNRMLIHIWDPYGVNNLSHIGVTAVYCVYLAIIMGPIWSSSGNFHMHHLETSGKHMGNLSPIWTIWAVWDRSWKYMGYLGNYLVKIWTVWEISGLGHMGAIMRPWTQSLGTFLEIPSEPQICVIIFPICFQIGG